VSLLHHTVKKERRRNDILLKWSSNSKGSSATLLITSSCTVPDFGCIGQKSGVDHRRTPWITYLNTIAPCNQIQSSLPSVGMMEHATQPHKPRLTCDPKYSTNQVLELPGATGDTLLIITGEVSGYSGG